MLPTHSRHRHATLRLRLKRLLFHGVRPVLVLVRNLRRKRGFSPLTIAALFVVALFVLYHALCLLFAGLSYLVSPLPAAELAFRAWRPTALDTSRVHINTTLAAPLLPTSPSSSSVSHDVAQELVVATQPVFGPCSSVPQGEVNHTHWSAWEGLVNPVNPAVFFQYMHAKAGDGVRPGRRMQTVAWVKPAPESDHHHVPLRLHLWARNITRSAKQHFADRVVLISFLAFDFLRFDAAFRELLGQMGMAGVSPQAELMRASEDLSTGEPGDNAPSSDSDATTHARDRVLKRDAVRAATRAATAAPANHTTCEQGDVVYVVMGKQLMLRSVNVRAGRVFVLGESMLSEDQDESAAQHAALIEVADLYVSVDDSMLEIAAKLHTPTIAALSLAAAFPSHLAFHKQHTDTLNGVSEDTLAALAASLLHHTCTQAPDVTFHSYVDPTMGYGSSAEQMVRAMQAATNPPTRLRFLPSQRPRPPNWRSLVHNDTAHMLEAVEGVGRVYLGYFVPHEDDVRHLHWHARKAMHTTVYTTFEATKVPAGWPALVNNFDALVVSCDAIAEAFRRGGVSVPIHVVPLGVAVADWPLQDRNWNIVGAKPAVRSASARQLAATQRQARPSPSPQPPVPFRFLLYADGQWINHRKNYDLVLKAFMKAFPARGQGGPHDAELWIKVSTADAYVRHLLDVKPPNVFLIVGKLPQPELLELLAECHCLVFPSHGEGFGLPPREAMATGIPSIHAGFAGLASVSSPELSIPLPFSLVPARGYDVWVGENLNSTDFGLWAGVTADDVAALMLAAQRAPEEVRRRGLAGAVHVRRSETYAHVGRRLVEILPGLRSPKGCNGDDDRPKAPPEGKPAKQSSAG